MEGLEQPIRQIKQEKDGVFRIDTSFDYRKWKGIKDRLNELERESDEGIRTQEFIDIFKDVYTEPRRGAEQEGGLPPIALVATFEASMQYLLLDVDDSYKREIVELQLAALTDHSLDTAARESIGGIWAYYADRTRTFNEADHGRAREAAVRDELTAATENVSTSDPKRLKLLSAAERGLDAHDDPEMESMRYFAELYAGDIKPIEPELTGVVAHEVFSRDSVTGHYERTGERMAPHQRFYTFANNRLPTPGVVAEGRAHLAITLGREGQAEIDPNDTEAFFDYLPDCLMDLYVQQCMDLRAEAKYRSKPEESRREDRLELTRRFVKKLLSGAFDRFCIEKGATPEELDRLNKIIPRYAASSGAEAIVGAIIDINKDSY